MNRRNADGFTLVEILAAMLFVAIVIPVVVEGMSVAHRAGVVAARSRVASQLADRMLSDLVVTGEYAEDEQEGDFEPDFPGYTWVLTSDAWSEDTMREVTVTVFFNVQGREYRVAMSTLAPETGL